MIEYLKNTREFARAQLRKIGFYDFVRIKQKEARYDKGFAERNANFDAFVLSFPKSGRTWHRVMLGYYLARLTGAAATKAMELEELCRRAGTLRLEYSHNAATAGRLPASSRCVASPALWRGRKVLLLVREPKAVLVSAFHHARFRSGFFDGGLPEFIRNSSFGVDKIATAYRRWHDNRHQASEFIVASYEHMHARPEEVLRRTVAFIGLRPDETLLREAVDFARFDNMKQYENTDFLKFRGMRKKRAGDAASGSKVREGKTDSYKSHLTEDDIAYIDRRLAELGGNPFAAESALAPP